MTNKSILEQSFTECLKLTDKIIFISLAVLGFGLILSVNTQSSEQDFAIPILDTHVSSLVTALWLIIILHFCNGVRFIFVVARAVSIAKRLPEDTLPNSFLIQLLSRRIGLPKS
jgi:succinate dehydrogenase/fumarate reductase cytochrome b subunit